MSRKQELLVEKIKPEDENKEEEEVEEVEGEEVEEAEGEEVEEQEHEQGKDGEKEEEVQVIQLKEDEDNQEKKENKEKKLKGNKGASLKRRKSLYEGFDETQELFRPEYRFSNNDPVKEKMWELMDAYLPRDKLSIQKSIVNHIEYTLARTRFQVDENYIFQGTALSVRDRLLEQWNDTQMYIRINNPKKIYYLSIEFLLGRLLQNALVNLELEDRYRDALMDFGVKLEEIYEVKMILLLEMEV
jgi:hypothetical protein